MKNKINNEKITTLPTLQQRRTPKKTKKEEKTRKKRPVMAKYKHKKVCRKNNKVPGQVIENIKMHAKTKKIEVNKA